MTADEPGSAEYWDHRYTSIGDTEVSWFQASPTLSLDLIAQVSDPSASVVDVGGGASRLVDRLLESGYRDVTVVDLSAQALATGLERVGDSPVTWIAEDVRDWQPARTFDVWHDRAAYHFLVEADDQRHYWQLVHDTVPVGGHVIIATFAEDGPQTCSGLPVQRYSAEALAEAMGERFTVVESRREEHLTPAGASQAFQWVLARRD